MTKENKNINNTWFTPNNRNYYDKWTKNNKNENNEKNSYLNAQQNNNFSAKNENNDKITYLNSSQNNNFIFKNENNDKNTYLYSPQKYQQNNNLNTKNYNYNFNFNKYRNLQQKTPSEIDQTFLNNNFTKKTTATKYLNSSTSSKFLNNMSTGMYNKYESKYLNTNNRLNLNYSKSTTNLLNNNWASYNKYNTNFNTEYNNYSKNMHKSNYKTQETFQLICYKFYQRKRKFKYREFRNDHLRFKTNDEIEQNDDLTKERSSEKAEETLDLIEIKAKVDEAFKKIDTLNNDERQALQTEVDINIKKLEAYHNKTYKQIARYITNEANEAMEIPRSLTSFYNEYSPDLPFQNSHFQEYIELSKPGLLEDNLLKFYIQNHLNTSFFQAIKNKAYHLVNNVYYLNFDDHKTIELPKENLWSAEDERIFQNHLKDDKNFYRLVSALNKDIKDIVLHYYRTKKQKIIQSKRKAGRISDEDMKNIIETQWDEKSIAHFTNHIEIYGTDWTSYRKKFPDRVERDFKLLYRYILKYHKNSAITKQRKIYDDKEMMNKYLNEFTISQRQIFALYYPFIGRNWNEMAMYVNKTVNDVRGYYRYYFKKLSTNEKRFESSLKEVERDRLSCIGSPKRKEEEFYNESCGIIFEHKKNKF